MARSIRERVAAYRINLRRAGLRPIQLWVPDARRPGFAQECRRQSGLLQGDRHEEKTMAWLEEVADQDDWQ
ncbi:MAG: antitoxin MazE family protein [Wenzhouxiangella sp.]